MILALAVHPRAALVTSSSAGCSAVNRTLRFRTRGSSVLAPLRAHSVGKRHNPPQGAGYGSRNQTRKINESRGQGARQLLLRKEIARWAFLATGVAGRRCYRCDASPLWIPLAEGEGLRMPAASDWTTYALLIGLGIFTLYWIRNPRARGGRGYTYAPSVGGPCRVR